VRRYFKSADSFKNSGGCVQAAEVLFPLRSMSMSKAVDLVIVGMTTADARVAALDAARRGQRVLVVDRTTDRRRTARFRLSLDDTADVVERIAVLTGVEVVCVDGVHAVEAVLLRRLRTGVVIGINAREVLVADKAQFSSHAGRGDAA
jgi:hypothetical protein